ncbi:MAG: flagellar assembly protein FliW [Clostridiaceae bacterium]|nr:flagellar assembly protein FliW [Clostridiaceae bacterium]
MVKIDTRYFGEIEIEQEKIIHFEQGIPGFDEYKDYTILYDVEESEPLFSWLQCVTEKGLALPIVNPFRIMEEYNPVVDDDLLEPLGAFEADDLVIFLIATVPEDVKKASVNMKAPLIINTANRQAMQIIAENEEYEIRHPLLSE